MSPDRRLPQRVTVVEVAPRDGLQSEAQVLDIATKVRLIDELSRTGTQVIEATSFVSPKAVPQLADADEVLARIDRQPGVRYTALVPNERGLERAIAARVDEIAIFASASETYSRKNLNSSRAEALAAYAPVVRRAKDHGLRVRAYLSMVFADPWEGATSPEVAVDGGRRLLDLGADELCLGDTIGAGTVTQVRALIGAYVAAGVAPERLAVHFHDTYGQALVNVIEALAMGITTVDASAGGIGGSPYAPGAAGNLATEDLVWMLDGCGVDTGIDVNKVAAVSAWMARELRRELPGRVSRALARQA